MTREDPTSWSFATEELEFLLDSIVEKARLSPREVEMFDASTIESVLKSLRHAPRHEEWRKRISLAYSAVRRVEDRSSFVKAVDVASFSFFRLHLLRPGTAQGQAMAWAEMCLFLGQAVPKAARTKWFPTVRNAYLRNVNRGTVPAWGEIARIEAGEIRSILNAVRAGLGHQPFSFESLSAEQIPHPSQPESASVPANPSPAAPEPPELSRIRVRAVTIAGFRGIPGPLKIDFGDKNDKPQSVIITGDNGVGKSSIVSAVEFACQGRIGRRSEYNSSAAPVALNASAGGVRASVTVLFSDGTEAHRSLVRSDGTVNAIGDRPRSDFAVSPMSLQRSDIVRFLATPPEERGLLFVDHFLTERHVNVQSADSRISLARSELAALKAQRRELVQKIADRTGQPAGMNYVELVQRGYFEGLTKTQYEDRYGRGAPVEGVHFLAELEKLGRRIGEKKRVLRALEPSKAVGLYEQRLNVVASLLADMDEPLTAAFRTVTGIDWIRSFRVFFGRAAALSVEIEVELQNGSKSTPEQLFSEGYQDLVAFLFMLEVSRASAARGQARVVILDDVFQSVDAGVRLAMFAYALQVLEGWQIFLTVHDSLWKAQVMDVMRRKNFSFSEIAIRRWQFESGPLVIGESRTNVDELRDAIDRGSVPTICSEAGRMLEQICDRLSHLLPISVTRRAGDRYTLGDLWPGIAKKLKASTAVETVDELDRWLHLRNLVGAHYNDWARSLATSDAEQFGLATLSFYAQTFCENCRQWVRQSPEKGTWVCRCSRTAIRPR